MMIHLVFVFVFFMFVYFEFPFYKFTSWNLEKFLPKVQMPNYSQSSSIRGATFDSLVKPTDFPHETN